MAQKEPFLPDHGLLSDADLLALPAQGPLTEPVLFVCTYEADLGNLHMDVASLTRLICENMRDPIVAINSNSGHGCRPGYEHLVKAPKPPPVRTVPMKGRPRKTQGDGTCFNSAIEPILQIAHPGIKAEKLYKVKCFPTTGKTQIPGVLCSNLSDGCAILNAFVEYLNELNIGDELADANADANAAADAAAPAAAADVGAAAPAAAAAGPVERMSITILNKRPNMLNYKFRIVRSSPRILVNLRQLAAYMCNLQSTEAVEGKKLSDAQIARFTNWPAILLPPFPVRETKPPTDDVKVSFRFENGDRLARENVGKKRKKIRAPRINIFQGGKINILGAATEESAQKIYSFFVNLFKLNWSMLICLQPRRDSELRAAPKAAAAAAQMDNAEFDSFFNEIFDSPPAEGVDPKIQSLLEKVEEWDFGSEDEEFDDSE